MRMAQKLAPFNSDYPARKGSLFKEPLLAPGRVCSVDLGVTLGKVSQFVGAAATTGTRLSPTTHGGFIT